MLYLSEILIQHPEMESFSELTEQVRARAHAGERFFRMDVRPPYPDTPDDWEEVLEAAFTGALS